MLLLAEVLRILGIGSSDDVPAGPAVAQMVQRGELAGKQERLLIGRVRGGNEADMPGVLSQRGQEGDRLEHRRARRRDDRLEHLRIVHVMDAQAVGKENPVELAALGRLRSEEPTSELPSLMRLSSAVFCL